MERTNIALLLISLLLFGCTVRNEGYNPLNCADPLAQLVIKQFKLDKVESCSLKKYPIEGKELALVMVKYGEPQDCPAGCIYQGLNAITDGQMIENFSNKAFNWPATKGIGCGFKYGNMIGVSENYPGVKMELVKQKGEYLLKYSFDRVREDNSYGSICEFNGYYTNILNPIFDKYGNPDKKNTDLSHLSVTFVKLGSPSSCDERVNNAPCYIHFAQAMNDVKQCDRIPTFKRDVYWCYYQYAIFADDPSICPQIPALEDSHIGCITYFAKNRNDIQYCSSLKDPKWEGHCINEVAKINGYADLSLCDKITDDNYATQCYLNFASTNKRMDVCIKIKDSNWRNSCEMKAQK